MNEGTYLGYVDGSVDTSTQRFNVVLDDDAIAELDDIVVCRQQLPGGAGELAHYGIIVEGAARIEGASLASDTQRIFGTRTMPGQAVRMATVQVLRMHPERWVPPSSGARVERAQENDRIRALFQDRMGNNALPLGVDRNDQPVYVDFSFLNGEKGAHISISGISGVAAKTSYALFALYMIMETDHGRELLGREVAHTKAVVFNVKGEDLLHIDRANSKFDDDPDARRMWAGLAVNEPRPFQSVSLYVPPQRGGGQMLAGRVATRRDNEYRVYGWSPLEFIRRGLLSFVFADTREQNQVSFVVDHVRAALARHAVPSAHHPGAVILRPNPVHNARDFERASELLSRAQPENANGDPEIKDFSDLAGFLLNELSQDPPNAAWIPTRSAGGTNDAFIRRLMGIGRRLGHLIDYRATCPALESNVNVIDINALHEDAQRFVVGAVLDQIWTEKQSSGREPLRFVVLDELNKYAPREGRSPIKDILVDIAARGRSLGVILIGCQQNASRVENAIVDNAAIKVVGRLDASHAEEYKFLSPELRQRATRFLPGTVVLDQPVVPAPIPILFPFPPYATNVSEDPIGATATADGRNPLDRVAL
jgi:DNA helicase HerA-like ATPase